MKRLALFLFITTPLVCQINGGELRLRVSDPEGLGLPATIQIISDANQYHAILSTSDRGELHVEHLPYGVYILKVEQRGFAPHSEAVNIQSSLPTMVAISLSLDYVNQSVTVNAENTMTNPFQPGSESEIGSDFIHNRLTSIPGRDLQDLLNSQPGWLYEGNAVLHPRGSEYQTQFVVDGVPLTDNRSPSFGPEIEADDVESMSVFTSGIPAEYGRKMGGVVVVNTLENPQQGFHGNVALSGGSFDSKGAFAKGQYAWGKNTLTSSASASTTEHYLNPVVPQNFSNTGTVGDFSQSFARDLTPNDRIKFTVRHELARYDIPNELVQQSTGQRQNADNFETMGIASYEHIFSPNAAADVRGMVRDNSNDFYSNPESTPIILSQHNWFREGYFMGAITIDHRWNEWKAGLESDSIFLNEKLNYDITDSTQFDPGTPSTFAYQANRPDLEQAGFVQDLVHLHNWTFNAGLRWDHYQLLLNRQDLEPRFAISRYFQRLETVIHFSYDRVFQTPSFENILLSSSSTVASIDPTGFLNLPVKPSNGNYYEAGLTKVFVGHLKLGGNYFRRVVDNYADDSQILNTTISFPISFRNAVLYGAEGKIDLPQWHRFSGFGTYSYIVGNAWFPVTGGLFFGADASQAAPQLKGHFPDSQDQRNSARGRIHYQLTPRIWAAFGVQYDSGLPFQFDGDPSTVLAEYGQQVLSRINFARGRIYPAFQANASASAEVYRSERVKMRLQADGQNLNNILNVIDFGGLFSGNAIGPSRSFSLRLATDF